MALHRQLLRLALLAVLIGLALTACGPRSTRLPESEAQAFGAEVEPIIENLLIGLSERDYARHARDFDEDMRKQIDEIVVFPQVYDQVIGVVGPYRSHALVEVQDQHPFRIAIYRVAFENDPDVSMRVVFLRDDPEHRISGLWFDSERLREQ